MERIGTLDGLKTMTGSLVNASKILISRYMGKEEEREDYSEQGNEEIDLKVFISEIEDLILTTKEIKKILYSFYQEEVIMAEFIEPPGKDKGKCECKSHSELNNLVH